MTLALSAALVLVNVAHSARESWRLYRAARPPAANLAASMARLTRRSRGQAGPGLLMMSS